MALNLQEVKSLESLINELDRWANRDKEQEDSDLPLVYDEVMNAILHDVRYIERDKFGRPTEWEFHTDAGDNGFVFLNWNNHQVQRIAVDYPQDTSYCEWRVNWNSTKPWQLTDVEFDFLGAS